MKSVVCKLTSDANGNATATSLSSSGYLAGISIQNDATLTASALWDVNVKDLNDVSLYTNTALFSTADTNVCPALSTYFKYPVMGGVSAYGTNMGDGKVANVIIYIDDQ